MAFHVKRHPQVSAAAASAAFFGESSNSSMTELVLYFSGLGLIVGGVVMLIITSIDQVLKETEADGEDFDGSECGERPSSVMEYVSDVILPSPERQSGKSTPHDAWDYAALTEEASPSPASMDPQPTSINDPRGRGEEEQEHEDGG